LLFRVLARLRTDCEVGGIDDWRWTGPTSRFPETAQRLGDPDLVRRAEGLARRRA
jgi:hypothetical protein